MRGPIISATLPGRISRAKWLNQSHRTKVNERNGDFSVRREKALVHSGKERPARELDRSTR
jgi:hypothetical protein